MSLPAKQYNGYTYADMLLWDDSTRYELYDGEPVA
ncbi:MAG: Uma2 family endonuclease, partial [Clostridiaceae bacterium]|nr:Uma2 family endonuclease [Clostridiaceae bacterium]